MLNELRPDFAGFIFAPSKRQVSLEQALEIRASLDEAIPAVGVFVNEPIENIVAIVESRAIQIVQLHGDEDNAYIEELGSGSHFRSSKRLRSRTPLMSRRHMLPIFSSMTHTKAVWQVEPERHSTGIC